MGNSFLVLLRVIILSVHIISSKIRIIDVSNSQTEWLLSLTKNVPENLVIVLYTFRRRYVIIYMFA